jgi:hypothetical protein
MHTVNCKQQKDVDMLDGAPFRLNGFMSLNCFKAISAAMEYTDKPPPPDFVDRFHDVRQMIDAFNDHYAEEYIPSWFSCLEESMNSWLNKYCLWVHECASKASPRKQ